MSIKKKKNLFIIDTKNASYAFTVNKENRLIHLYWGKRLYDALSLDMPLYDEMTNCMDRSLPYEYAAGEAFYYDDNALRVDFGDGIRNTQLKYDDNYEIRDNQLVVYLCDDYYALNVELHYTVYFDLDLITRYAVIRNDTEKTIKLNRCMSASLHLGTGSSYRITHYRGAWGSEFQKEQGMLDFGKFIIQNNHGNTSGPHAFPGFFMDEGGLANEGSGTVYFATIHWSGDFKITIEKNAYKHVNISIGMNDEDTVIHLATGETFTTPMITAGVSFEGFGRATRNLYDYQFDYLLPQKSAHTPFPVLYNAYVTYFNNIDEKKLLDLIPLCEKVGVELFVVDDGWMPGRTEDTEGLGDWVVDESRFPNGLEKISDSVHNAGMLFGLWIEPEMGNYKSRLFEQHKDWFFQTPNRPYTLSRSQLVLNMTKKEVCDWAVQTIDRIITRYKVDYLKWDMNRYISDFGFAGSTDQEQDEMRIRYIRNVYYVWDEITKRHPEVLYENCAHGGARADYGMLKYSDRINRSDDGACYDVALTHEGFTTFFVPKLAGGAGNFNGENGMPFEFRKNMAYTASCSLGFNLKQLSDSDLEKYREAIEQFKEERGCLQDAYVYHLKSVYDSPYAVWQYLKRDSKVITLFAFAVHKHYYINRIDRIKFLGIDPGSKYRCENDGKVYTGESLLYIGMDLTDYIKHNFDSCRLKFELIEDSNH